MINLMLFISFMKFSVLCFGGGYVIIPMLYSEYVEKTPVFSVAEFGNLLSISQITPGAVSMNSATYVGYLQNGFGGALFASIGLIVPTLILSTIAMHCIAKWKGSFIVEGILKGTRLGALAMVVYASLLFLGMSVFSMQIPYQSIFESLISFQNKLPDDFKLNFVELIVCVVSFITVKTTRFSITKLLFLSGLFGAVLGYLF